MCALLVQIFVWYFGVLQVIKALARDGMTMICVTHEVGFARELADEVWCMRSGRLEECGRVSAVLSTMP